MLKRLPFRKTITGVITTALFVLASTVAVQAATYTCGAYGGGDYNENCPPSSSSSGGSSSGGSQTTTVEEGEKVILNDFEEYMSDEGKTLEVGKDQVIYFNLLDGSTTVEHYLTVVEVGADYVIVRFDGSTSDVRIKLGQTLKYDVDGDGIPDIEFTLVSINGVLAAINFRQLEQPDKDTNEPATNEESEEAEGWPLWKILSVGFGILLVIMGIILAFVTWRRNKSGPNSGGNNVIHP